MKIIKEAADKKSTLDYVDELIQDMQSAEGIKFTKNDLKDRIPYIKIVMKQHKMTLSDQEILDLLK